MESIFKSFGQFLFHLLWLAIAEGLTVEFLVIEISAVREKISELRHEEEEHINSTTIEKFPDYVRFPEFPTIS